MTSTPTPPMDPTSARPPAPRAPVPAAPVSRALVWVNAIVFVAELALSGNAGKALAGSIPERVMLAFGANDALLTVGDHRFETLVTSCFLHFSLVHVGFNLYALWQIGPFVERAVGSARFATMYVGSGIVGSAASTAIGWFSGVERVSAGASGAICGVIGAALVLGVRTQGWRGPLTAAMARWLGLTLVFGFLAKFDNAAHAGGAIAGAVSAALWRREARPSPARHATPLAIAAAIPLVCAAVVAWRDATDPFATLPTDARIARTLDALRAGDCAAARAAFARTVPTASTTNARRSIAETLGRNCPPAAND